MPLNPGSPRLVAVLTNGAQLLAIVESVGANGVALCGSVARGEDSDEKQSDLDFFVHVFQNPDATDARGRADRLVNEYRALLRPIGVDVRGIPGWPAGPAHEATMRRDSIDLRWLVDQWH